MSRLKKFSILVVDDESKNIQLIGTILNQEGYDVEFATNGEEALEWALSRPFDLILLDVVMPGMDGFEVCRKLQSDEMTKEIPIIFITVKEGEDDEVTGLELGAADYIAKPLRPTVLRARVKNQLRLRESTLKLKQMNKELQEALDQITTLRKLLPICAHCKKIRKKDEDPFDENSWVNLEEYLTDHANVMFTHSICPVCKKAYYPDFIVK